MSLKFECCVQIDGKKFDLIDPNRSVMPTFSEIYPNIVKIVGLGANQVVGLNSHKFFISKNSTDTKFRAEEFTRTLDNHSIITIEPKAQPNRSVFVEPNRPSFPRVSSIHVEPLTQEPTLDRQVADIQLFRSIVLAINIGWDLRDNERNWQKVWQGLDRNYRNSLTALTTQQHFYVWANYYAQNYCKLNNKLDPKDQEIFDLLKVIHILNLDQIYSSDNSNRLEIQKISETIEFERYYNQCLVQLRQQKVHQKEQNEQRLTPTITRSDFFNRNRSSIVRSYSDLTNRRNSKASSVYRKWFDIQRPGRYYPKYQRGRGRDHY